MPGSSSSPRIRTPNTLNAWTAASSSKRGNSTRLPVSTNRSLTPSAVPYLADAELVDQAKDIRGGDIVNGVFALLLEPLAEVFGSEEAGLAVGQVAPGARAKLPKRGMGQADDHAAAVHEEFAVNRVAVARGDAVPQVRKAAVVELVGEL